MLNKTCTVSIALSIGVFTAHPTSAQSEFLAMGLPTEYFPDSAASIDLVYNEGRIQGVASWLRGYPSRSFTVEGRLISPSVFELSIGTPIPIHLILGPPRSHTLGYSDGLIWDSNDGVEFFVPPEGFGQDGRVLLPPNECGASTGGLAIQSHESLSYTGIEQLIPFVENMREWVDYLSVDNFPVSDFRDYILPNEIIYTLIDVPFGAESVAATALRSDPRVLSVSRPNGDCDGADIFYTSILAPELFEGDQISAERLHRLIENVLVESLSIDIVGVDSRVHPIVQITDSIYSQWDDRLPIIRYSIFAPSQRTRRDDRVWDRFEVQFRTSLGSAGFSVGEFGIEVTVSDLYAGTRVITSTQPPNESFLDERLNDQFEFVVAQQIAGFVSSRFISVCSIWPELAMFSSSTYDGQENDRVMTDQEFNRYVEILGFEC